MQAWESRGKESSISVTLSVVIILSPQAAAVCPLQEQKADVLLN